MIKFFIVLAIIIVVAIVVIKNKRILIELIKCKSAMWIINNKWSKNHDIDYDKLIEEVEPTKKNNSTLSKLLEILDENPEIEKAIKEQKQKEIEEDLKYNYPIKRSQAIKIANSNNTLKTDFCRNSNRGRISFLGFYGDIIDIVNIDGRVYWQYQVTRGDVSWIELKNDSTTYCDGYFCDDDLKYLRCLIDVETGDYIYYPNVKKYKERTVKYSDAINGVIAFNAPIPEWMQRIYNEDNKKEDGNYE